MATSIWYKDKLLYDGSGGVISGLSERIINTASHNGNVSDDVLAFLASLIYSTDRSLECLSLEDLKVLTQLLKKTTNDFDEEGYFNLEPGEVEYRIKHNISLNIPRSDKIQALNLIKGLEEVIKELEEEKSSNVR